MMWLSWLIFVVSLALQVLVLNSLRRGAYKDYSLVFAYSLVLFFTTIADGAMWAKLIPLPMAMRNVYFYRNEAVRQFMLFAVVISLIDHAIGAAAYRVRVRAILVAVGVASVLISLQIHSSSSHLFSYWMTQVSRDLSFESVGLTLLLWLTLISSGKKDHQLLMVTGGLGLQFTGEAIGQSFRQLSGNHPSALILGNIVAGGTHALRLYVWHAAFRKGRVKEKEPAGIPHDAGSRPARIQTSGRS